jgi:hypothetical protein
MNNTRLIRALQKLTKRQTKEFKQYIEWPYANTNQDVVNFYNVLLKFYPEFEETKISYEAIGSKIAEPKRANKEFISRMSHLLLDLLERYLTMCWAESSPIHREVAMLEYYGDENKTADFDTHMKRAVEVVNTSQMDVYDRFHWQYCLSVMAVSSKLGIGSLQKYNSEDFNIIYNNLHASVQEFNATSSAN